MVLEQDDSFTLLYIRDDGVIECFRACCQSIGRYGSLPDTVDYFVDTLKQNGMYRKEAVYVLSYILKGNPQNKWNALGSPIRIHVKLLVLKLSQ